MQRHSYIVFLRTTTTKIYHATIPLTASHSKVQNSFTVIYQTVFQTFFCKIPLVIYRERVFKLQNHVLFFGIFREMSGKSSYIVLPSTYLIFDVQYYPNFWSSSCGFLILYFVWKLSIICIFRVDIRSIGLILFLL